MSLLTLASLPELPGHSLVLAQAMGGGLTGNLVFIGLIFGIMYFVLIRPQQKQAKETQDMLSALKKGDDVVTTGGLLGKIFAIDDKVVTLEVGSGVKVRVIKSAVQARVTVEPAKTEGSDAKKEEK